MIDRQRLYTISELAREFALTNRAIRFYEEKALIRPQRVGVNRVYDYRDHARITLILKLKGLGFRIDDIKEYIDLYDADPGRITQLKHGLDRITQRINTVEEELSRLQQNLNGLREIRDEALTLLAKRGIDLDDLDVA